VLRKKGDPIYDLNVFLKNGEKETAVLFDIDGFRGALKQAGVKVSLTMA
jgi:hypothetical protein